MTPRTKAIIRTLAKLGATVLLLWLVLRAVGWEGVGAALWQVDWRWLVAMYVVLWVRQVILAGQLRYALLTAGARVSWLRVFLSSQLSSFYSLILPGNVAAGGVKWANLAAATGRKSTVLSAMFYCQLARLMMVMLVGVTALMIDNPLESRALVAAAAVMLALIVMLLLGLYVPRFGRRTVGLLRRLAGRLPDKAATKVGYILDGILAVHRFRRVDHAIILVIVCAIVGTQIGVLALAVRSMGLHVPVLSIVWIFAFLAAVRIVPLTIGSLGVREGLLIVAMRPLGVPEEQAVSVGLVMFTNLLFMALVGLGYQVALLAGWAKWRTAPAPGKSGEV